MNGELRCPRCGQPLPTSSAVSCPNCGQMLAMPAPQRKTGRTVAIVVVSVVLVVVLAVGLCCGGPFLLLPMIHSARDAARRTASSDNMSKLSRAVVNYQTDNGKYPGRASFSPDGTPLLSWRVHLLPYTGEVNLYNQFHIDEPWDSPHNIQFVSRMPKVYESPRGPPGSLGKTTYVVVVGNDTLFPREILPPSPNGVGPFGNTDVPDGLDKTAWLIEVPYQNAVVWTKPDDWEFKGTTDELFSTQPHVLYATPSGIVKGVMRSEQEELKKLFVRYDDALLKENMP